MRIPFTGGVPTACQALVPYKSFETGATDIPIVQMRKTQLPKVVQAAFQATL